MITKNNLERITSRIEWLRHTGKSSELADICISLLTVVEEVNRWDCDSPGCTICKALDKLDECASNNADSQVVDGFGEEPL